MPFKNVTTAVLHADESVADTPDVAPPIRLATTYKYADDLEDDGRAVYSRLGQNNVTRVEAVLSELLDGRAVAYSSGLSAFFAAVVALNPKRVFVSDGYHGVWGILHLLERNYGVKALPLNQAPTEAKEGDLIHVETPLNPVGTARDLSLYASARVRGAKLSVDATFAPPPLQNPFNFGADVVVHSASKYLGGHSDILAGVVVTRDEALHTKLLDDRIYLGTILPSLESWLLLRSLRTYNMRVRTQLQNANKIVEYLSEFQDELPLLAKVHHATLQPEDFVKQQMPLGGPMTFSIVAVNADAAKEILRKLHLFTHCTSLGGIHSTIELRIMSDPEEKPELLRISIGAEDPDDLIADLAQALGKQTA